ncbi:MAG: hypothetical protein U1F34_05715 [Gammaproteobacteria bacterium]
MRTSNKRYAFDLTRPLHRYVWQMGGILGKFSLILDSCGVIGLGLAGAGFLTLAFAANDRIVELGLRTGLISLGVGIACFGLARAVDFLGKFINGEDPRSLVLKERQMRSTDARIASMPEPNSDAVWRKTKPVPVVMPNVQPLRPVTNEVADPLPPTAQVRTGTLDRSRTS